MARSCLRNLQICTLTASEASTLQQTLLTTSQMWGSGKSWLGNHFLDQFCSERFAALRKQLAMEFGENGVSLLTHAKYVLIDFRQFQDMLNKSNLDQFVLHCLVSSLVQFFPEDGDFWSKQSMQRWGPQSIVSWFSEKHNQIFFIHFDEVDVILEAQPAVKSERLPAAERFYQFWQLVHPMLLKGNFLYCSGRSAILYALGKGLYQSLGLISPGKNGINFTFELKQIQEQIIPCCWIH